MARYRVNGTFTAYVDTDLGPGEMLNDLNEHPEQVAAAQIIRYHVHRATFAELDDRAMCGTPGCNHPVEEHTGRWDTHTPKVYPRRCDHPLCPCRHVHPAMVYADTPH